MLAVVAASQGQAMFREKMGTVAASIRKSNKERSQARTTSLVGGH